MEAHLQSRRRIVIALGLTQIVAWGGSYYLPAVLARSMASDLGLSETAVMAAFSGALLLTALLGPAVGRLIDARGGRDMLIFSNLVIAAGLAVLASAQGVVLLGLGWAVLGIGMATGLYEAAFATATGLFGKEARGAITGITLIAGFTSTLAWPLTTLLEAELGWRSACLTWAALQLLLGLPLNRLIVRHVPPPQPHAAADGTKLLAPPHAMLILGFSFAAVSFVIGAITAHLPELIEASGASPAAALLAASLIGPMQVLARLTEFALLRRGHPIWTARIASALQVVGQGLLLLGAGAAIPFAVLYGAGNGMNTIARGTLPLAVFGPGGYGARQGMLGAPARLAQATAPVLFGLVLADAGVHALWLTGGLCLAAFLALFALRVPLPAAGDAG